MAEEDTLNNFCANLVSEARLEPGLLRLFRSKAAGEWVPVGELYDAAGITVGRIKPELVAAWLPSPDGDAGGAVVLFFDPESLWSMAAWYNVARLRERHPDAPVAAAG